MPDPATPSPTDRAEAADADRERPAERRYRELVDRMPAAVFIQPVEVRAPATFVGGRITDLTGYTPDELLNEREFLVRFMHEDDVAPAVALARRCDRTLEPFHARFRVRHKDGRWIWVQSEAEIVRDDDGTPLHWQGFLLDVTAEQEALGALAEREELFRSTFEEAAIGMAIEAPDGTILQANRAFCDLLGHSLDEVHGLTYRDLLAEEHVAHAERQIVRLMAGELDAYTEERRVRRKNGSLVWLSMNVAAVRGPDGRPERMIVQVGDIDARKRAEARLAESEALLRSIFEDAAIGMGMAAADGDLLEVNPALCRMLGHDRDDLLSMGFPDITHPDDLPAEIALIEDLRSGKRDSYLIEKRYLHKDGGIVWVRLNASAVRGPDGALSRIVGQVEDITAERRAQAARAESDARLRSVFERGAIGIALMDAEGRYLDVNPAFCAMLGRSREALLGRSFANITYPGDIDEQQAVFRRLMAGEIDRFQLEQRYLRPDGGIVWARLNASTVATADGSARQAILSAEDVTETRRAQDALERSEARFRALVQRSTDVTMITRPGDGIAWISPAIRTLTGWEPDLPDPNLIERLVHPDDRPEVERVLADLHRSADGGAATVEFRARRLDGSWRWVEARGASQIDNPHVAGVVWNIRDVEERKAAEQAIAEALDLQRRAMADLEALDRQRGDFLAMIAHDFRTPLTAIQGYADLIPLERPGDPDLAASARAISDSAQRLNRMVRDLLTVETLEQRLDQLALEPTDPNALVQETVAALRGAWPGRDIALDLADGLPLLAVDRDQVTQAVTNLVANALKYSPERTTVTVRTRQAGDAVQIAVEDHGLGIPADRLEAIFDRYARVRTGAAKGVEGIGLGLPIVRAVARAHGGDVRAESAPGRGSTFLLTLPLGPAVPPRGETAPSGWHAPPAGDSFAAAL